MKLLRPLPEGNTYEQILNHFLVEKEIAEKLKSANREERKQIYATMYDELFEKVPYHSRLVRRSSEELTQKANMEKLKLVRKFLHTSSVFVEFAPGDCKFSFEAAKHVKTVYAVDISDQREPDKNAPGNFSLVVYDGYELDKIKDNSVDIVFSDQFIEHLHPEDTQLHFELAYRILKSGGKYIFRTPHAFTGPHDVSKFFSNKPQCFHLKEWTYKELIKLLKELNYSHVSTLRLSKGIIMSLPNTYYYTFEYLLNLFGQKYKSAFSRCLIHEICIVATK